MPLMPIASWSPAFTSANSCSSCNVQWRDGSAALMQYVRFGKTGIKVSRLCLGMMTYGSSRWRPWVLDEAESRPFVKRALELGINFFDTADMYSRGVSEEVTGRALKDFTRRDQVIVATKV